MMIKTGTIVKTINNNIYYKVIKVFSINEEVFYKVELVHIVDREKGTFVVVALKKSNFNKSWTLGNKAEQVLYGS